MLASIHIHKFSPNDIGIGQIKALPAFPWDLHVMVNEETVLVCEIHEALQRIAQLSDKGSIKRQIPHVDNRPSAVVHGACVLNRCGVDIDLLCISSRSQQRQ